MEKKDVDKIPNISYSAWQQYLTCGFSYFIGRVLRYEPLQKSSALIFGSAIDDAFNELLLTGNVKSAKTLFKKQIKPLFKTDSYYFFKGDFDYDILTDTQIQIGLDYLTELDYKGTLDLEVLHKTIFTKIYENGNDYTCITKNQQLFVSCISAMSLKQKGIMMIDAYVDKVLPQIDEVISVQRPTQNRVGFIDIEIKLKGHGNVTADHKTASRAYTQAQVDNSAQLAIYDKEAKNGQAAYIVFEKNVKKNKQQECSVCGFNGNGLRHKTCPDESKGKRCCGDWYVTISPEIGVQILVGDVNKKFQETVFRSLESVEEAIHKKCFPMNIEACANQFGKPCQFIDYCHNGSAKKLKKRPPRKG